MNQVKSDDFSLLIIWKVFIPFIFHKIEFNKNYSFVVCGVNVKSVLQLKYIEIITTKIYIVILHYVIYIIVCIVMIKEDLLFNIHIYKWWNQSKLKKQVFILSRWRTYFQHSIDIFKVYKTCFVSFFSIYKNIGNPMHFSVQYLTILLDT